MIIPIIIHRDCSIPYWTCWNCGELNHPMQEEYCKYCNAPEHPTIWQFIKACLGIKTTFTSERRTEK